MAAGLIRTIALARNPRLEAVELWVRFVGAKNVHDYTICGHVNMKICINEKKYMHISYIK